MNHHKCTAEDWKDFYPINEESKEFFEEEKDGFYCLDWTDDFEIYGVGTMDAQMIEFMLFPCNYIHTDMGN